MLRKIGLTMDIKPEDDKGSLMVRIGDLNEENETLKTKLSHLEERNEYLVG
jgi:hypothetical protein